MPFACVSGPRENKYGESVASHGLAPKVCDMLPEPVKFEVTFLEDHSASLPKTLANVVATSGKQRNFDAPKSNPSVFRLNHRSGSK
ncbi:hypothetical protein U1Q18_009965 [Sarracenia purpurea var. burkii]